MPDLSQTTFTLADLRARCDQLLRASLAPSLSSASSADLKYRLDVATREFYMAYDSRFNRV